MSPMTDHPANQLTVRRVTSEESNAAWEIVEEYYEAAGVVARDAKDDFERIYFRDGAGVWLATIADAAVGCIALRSLARSNDYMSGRSIEDAELRLLFIRAWRNTRASVAMSGSIWIPPTKWLRRSVSMPHWDTRKL
jgi:hypothetical protein